MRLKAFTLIELLIVIAIIAILALIAIPNFLEAQTRAKVSRVHADQRSLGTAIEAYFVDFNAYPYASHVGEYFVNDVRGYSRFLAWDEGWQAEHISWNLTTPIAYMSGRPPTDPFGEGSYVGYERYINPSYWYINFLNARPRAGVTPPAGNTYRIHPDVKGQGPAEVIFNGSEGKLYNAHWALISPGPDRSVKSVRMSDAGIANYTQIIQYKKHWESLGDGSYPLYDPTNGTVSAGSIWRLSGSSIE